MTAIAPTDVVILGAGSSEIGRGVGPPPVLAVRAGSAALQAAGLRPNDVGAVLVSNALGGALCDQHNMRGQSWLAQLGIRSAPIINIDNSCAGSSSATLLAIHTARSMGVPVLAVGVEQMVVGDTARTVAAIEHGMPAEERHDFRSRISARETIAMALNAQWATKVLDEHGGDIRGVAEVAVKAHRLGEANPLVRSRGVPTVDEVLESAVVTAPLTRLMCSSLADAGVAIVVGPDPGEGSRVRFRAAAALSGDGAGTYHESLRRLGVQLWESANLEDPADLSLAEIHDATAAEEVFASEILGLVRAGRGIEAARSGATLPGGSGVAINPSGGLVGRGHPLGATGLAQIYEGWLQLSGNAGGRQVPDARLAATINTGGISHGEMLVAHGFMLEHVAAHGPDVRHDTPLGPRAGVGLG